MQGRLPINNRSNYVAKRTFRLLPVFMKLRYERLFTIKLALVSEALHEVNTE